MVQEWAVLSHFASLGSEERVAQVLWERKITLLSLSLNMNNLTLDVVGSHLATMKMPPLGQREHGAEQDQEKNRKTDTEA